MLKLKLQCLDHLMWRTNLLKRPWCWERLKAGGERDNRGWDGWMVSPTRWTWVWASSGSWWWTGKPHVLQSMGSQRAGHDWATELNWIESSVLEGTDLNTIITENNGEFQLPQMLQKRYTVLENWETDLTPKVSEVFPVEVPPELRSEGWAAD